MSRTMKDLLTDEVRSLPGSPIPVEAVIGAGRRRLWRRRGAEGTATFAAVAALAFLAPSIVDWSGLGEDGGPATAGTFERPEVTYAKGSTIHYGDQRIDVSPRRVWSFVQTDDGFVFTTEAGDVYLADGVTVDQVGDGSEDGTLAADDTGSYVAWTDSRSEFVVYDTATREEVTRTPADNTETDGVHWDDYGPYVEAVDGDTAYWRTGAGVVAWDLTTQTGEVLVAHEEEFYVHDVADGQVSQLWTSGADLPRDIVVNDDPDVDRPRFPMSERSDLSPSARHLALGDLFVPPNGGVFDVMSGSDVTPEAPRDYQSVFVAQWIDDDRYVARALPKDGKQVDLLTCSIADDTCTVAASAIGSAAEIRFPVGEHRPF